MQLHINVDLVTRKSNAVSDELHDITFTVQLNGADVDLTRFIDGLDCRMDVMVKMDGGS